MAQPEEIRGIQVVAAFVEAKGVISFLLFQLAMGRHGTLSNRGRARNLGPGIRIPPLKLSFPTMVKWSKPHQGWIKASIDSSTRGNPGPSGGGGVGRDCNGNFLFAFAFEYGCGSNMRAEMRAIVDSISQCAQFEFSRVEVSNDSSSIVIALGKETHDSRSLWYWRKRIEALRRSMETSRRFDTGLRNNLQTLFAGNITFDTTAADLYRIFERYGKIVDAFIPSNLGLKHSRGYGFIRFMYEADAKAALDILDSKRVDGKIIIVQKAKSHSNPQPAIQLPTVGPKAAHPASQPSSLKGNRLFIAVVKETKQPGPKPVRRNATATPMLPLPPPPIDPQVEDSRDALTSPAYRVTM
ncbi:uncharacterized protein LOC131248934 [Magnolia sinica]|uniref:uncharacterized protein LOC131248934 n=1 Tax=Magnolia sinica TaxID=86752 RepID=UPI00265A45DE|nr:uncharacterized protein LOC131248934 [Magnolia sinica]